MEEFLIKEEKPWHKFWPKNVPKNIEIPLVSIHNMFEETANKNRNKVAIIFEDYKMTYGQLDDYSSRFANFLQEKGLKKGDRVAIYLPNIPQFAIALLGILKAGCIAVPHNPLYVERELEHQLSDSGSKAIITLDRIGDISFINRVFNVRGRTPLEQIIVTNIGDFLPSLKKFLGKLIGKVPKKEKYPNTYDLVEIIGQYDARYKKISIDPREDVALLQYTGGTTGIPKGAMLTHYNIVANVLQLKVWADIGAEDVMMGVLPFFHIFGLTVALFSALLTGQKIVLVPRFEVENVLKQVQKYKVTLLPGVPTMYVAINTHPKTPKFDLSSIRVCISGAAPLPVAVRKEFMRITGGILVEGYGLSETSPAVTGNPIDDPAKIRDGSIGIPFPNTDVKIIDVETGEELPPGEIGELVIKGPQVMKGYWNMPDETKEVLKDGWLRTGDIAKMDEDGYFYIVDRKKDMINAAGYKVWPREVEEVLYSHPKVKEAAVVGVPDQYRGETVKAFIVLKDEFSDSVRNVEEKEKLIHEIDAHCRKHLAAYKVPKKYEFKKELPKSLVGKVLRRVLREKESEHGKTQ